MWTGFGITESMFRFRDECKRTSLFLGRAEVVEIKYHDTYNNQMVHQKAHKENVAAATAKSLQSWPTLCDPIDGSPPGSPVPGILQARTLEWVAISFSNAWKWKVKVKSFSRVRLLATPWTAAHPAPPSLGFSRQEYWSGVPLPSPRKCYKLLNLGASTECPLLHLASKVMQNQVCDTIDIYYRKTSSKGFNQCIWIIHGLPWWPKW